MRSERRGKQCECSCRAPSRTCSPSASGSSNTSSLNFGSISNLFNGWAKTSWLNLKPKINREKENVMIKFYMLVSFILNSSYNFSCSVSGAVKGNCFLSKWICDGEFLQSPRTGRSFSRVLKKLRAIQFSSIKP